MTAQGRFSLRVQTDCTIIYIYCNNQFETIESRGDDSLQSLLLWLCRTWNSLSFSRNAPGFLCTTISSWMLIYRVQGSFHSLSTVHLALLLVRWWLEKTEYKCTQRYDLTVCHLCISSCQQCALIAEWQTTYIGMIQKQIYHVILFVRLSQLSIQFTNELTTQQQSGILLHSFNGI